MVHGGDLILNYVGSNACTIPAPEVTSTQLHHTINYDRYEVDQKYL